MIHGHGLCLLSKSLDHWGGSLRRTTDSKCATCLGEMWSQLWLNIYFTEHSIFRIIVLGGLLHVLQQLGRTCLLCPRLLRITCVFCCVRDLCYAKSWPWWRPDGWKHFVFWSCASKATALPWVHPPLLSLCPTLIYTHKAGAERTLKTSQISFE